MAISAVHTLAPGSRKRTHFSRLSRGPDVVQVELIRSGVVPMAKVDGSPFADKHRLDVRTNTEFFTFSMLLAVFKAHSKHACTLELASWRPQRKHLAHLRNSDTASERSGQIVTLACLNLNLLRLCAPAGEQRRRRPPGRDSRAPHRYCRPHLASAHPPRAAPAKCALRDCKTACVLCAARPVQEERAPRAQSVAASQQAQLPPTPAAGPLFRTAVDSALLSTPRTLQSGDLCELMLLSAMEAAAGPVPDGPRVRFDLNGAVFFLSSAFSPLRLPFRLPAARRFGRAAGEFTCASLSFCTLYRFL